MKFKPKSIESLLSGQQGEMYRTYEKQTPAKLDFRI